jgi:predicted aldo/keto reductase-like oxidoreductase
MLHNLIVFEDWERLKSIGIIDFIEKEKKNGRIINIGFSYHGNLHDFKKIIDDYEWEFTLIQYNYVDENYQAGRKGIEYAKSKDIAAIIMEPLRGGMLIDKLPKKAQKIIDNFQIKRTPADWALRWLWNQEDVKVVLSGMNEEKHIEDNIELASKVQVNSLTEEELNLINELKTEFTSKIKVNCTSCAYCMPCPQRVDIPTCFSSYNDKSMFGGFRPQLMYVNATGDKSAAYKCSQCGVCEPKCPQEIAIMDELKNASKSLDHWYLRGLGKIVKFLMYKM